MPAGQHARRPRPGPYPVPRAAAKDPQRRAAGGPALLRAGHARSRQGPAGGRPNGSSTTPFADGLLAELRGHPLPPRRPARPDTWRANRTTRLTIRLSARAEGWLIGERRRFLAVPLGIEASGGGCPYRPHSRSSVYRRNGAGTTSGAWPCCHGLWTVAQVVQQILDLCGSYRMQANTTEVDGSDAAEHLAIPGVCVIPVRINNQTGFR